MRRATLIATILALICTPAPCSAVASVAGAAEDEAWAKEVSSLLAERQEFYLGDRWGRLPRHVVHGAVKRGLTREPAVLASTLADLYALSPEDARRLLTVTAFSLRWAGAWNDQAMALEGRLPRPRRLDRLAGELQSLAGAAGTEQARRALTVELAAFYGRWIERVPGFAAAAHHLVQAEPELDLLALLDLADAAEAVLRYELELRPDHPAALLALAERARAPLVRAALYGAARRGLPGLPQEPPAEIATFLLREEMTALIEMGLERRAMELLDSAPETVVDRLLAGCPEGAGSENAGSENTGSDEAGSEHTRSQDEGTALRLAGWTVGRQCRDRRPELAVGAVLAGRLELAAQLSAARGEPTADSQSWQPGHQWGWQRELLAAAIAPPRDDLFPLLARLLDHDTALYSFPWLRLAAEVTEQGGYPRAADYFRREAERAGERAAGPTDWKLELLSGSPSAQDEALVLAEQGLAAIEAVAERRGAGRAASDVAAEGVAAALAMPSATELFALEPIAGPAPDPWARQGALLDSTRPDFVPDLPPGVPLRALAATPLDAAGPRVVLAEGSDLLVGDGGGGNAYWLLTSDDGGATWSSPLYTGLVVFAPLRVEQGTVLEPVGDGRWRLPVTVGADRWQLPMLTVAEPPKQATLTLDLAILQSDGDGDGLSDLMEARLVTDPGHPDSDRDGLYDAEDPHPQLPDGLSPSAESELLLELLLAGKSDRWWPWLPGPPEALRPRYRPLEIPAGIPVPPRPIRLGDAGDLASHGHAPGEVVQLVAADRSLLAALAPPDRRVTALTLDEVAALGQVKLEEHRRPRLAIELMVVDHAEQRAIVVFRGARSNGRIELARREGRWRPATRVHNSGGCVTTIEEFAELPPAGE